jgi:hypothetical protein
MCFLLWLSYDIPFFLANEVLDALAVACGLFLLFLSCVLDVTAAAAAFGLYLI